MNEIIALQKYENEAQLAKELIRGFWLAHGDYVITDEEAAENLAAWTDKGHAFYPVHLLVLFAIAAVLGMAGVAVV